MSSDLPTRTLHQGCNGLAASARVHLRPRDLDAHGRGVPDPETAARRANIGARLELERLARTEAPFRPDDTLERRLEAIEAAIYAVFRFADEVDDLARHAVERAEAA